MAKKLETHPLIAKLAPDPTAPPDLVRLIGFIGPASCKGHWRIYHSLDLSSYTEVPGEAIEHVEPLEPGNENSPSVILAKGGARAQTVVRKCYDLGSGYLGGPIARTYLPGAEPPILNAGGVGQDPGTSPFTICFNWPTITPCPVRP